MPLLRLVPDKTAIPFMRGRRVTFGISAVLIAASFIAMVALGFNFGIDFLGGTLVEARNRSGPVNLAEVRSSLGALGLGDVQVQEFGQPQDVLIRLPEQPGGEPAQQAAVTRVRTTLGDNYDIRRVEVVGPSVSSELRRDGAIAVVLSLLGVFLYLWFRFEWQFALAAVFTLVHDLILTMGMLAALQITFDLAILAAILTLVGYSLNDTVVIYDRIRENLRRYKKMPLPELIDTSINETLSRSVMTSMTTFLAVLALFLFGGEALRGFNFTILFGVVVGTYSTIVISAPLLISFRLRAGEEPKAGRQLDTGPAPAKAGQGRP